MPRMTLYCWFVLRATTLQRFDFHVLENATERGNMPVPNEAAPRRMAITKMAVKPAMIETEIAQEVYVSVEYRASVLRQLATFVIVGLEAVALAAYDDDGAP